MSKRPEHPCTWCGRTTTSRKRVCQACATCATTHAAPAPEHALLGGTWRLHRGIRIWQPYTATQEAA